MVDIEDEFAGTENAEDAQRLPSRTWEVLGRFYAGVEDYGAADAALGQAIEIEPTSANFMADALYSARCLRTLNVIDEGNRQHWGARWPPRFPEGLSVVP